MLWGGLSPSEQSIERQLKSNIPQHPSVTPDVDLGVQRNLHLVECGKIILFKFLANLKSVSCTFSTIPDCQ